MTVMNRRRFCMAFLTASVLTACGEGGKSDETMETLLSSMLRKGVDRGHFPGGIISVRRHGQPLFELTAGQLSATNAAPVTGQSLFRIFEMTQTIVAMAALKAVQAGRLSLDMPMTDLIPELKVTSVRDDSEDESDTRRNFDAITLQHLLTQTSGYLGPVHAPKSDIERRYNFARLEELDDSREDFLSRVDNLALGFAPGTGWAAGISPALIAIMLEREYDQPLDELLAALVFEPLGLTDTGFAVPENKEEWLSNPLSGQMLLPRAFRRQPSGMIGLFSTAEDQFRILATIRTFGAGPDGEYLGLDLARLMTTDVTVFLDPELVSLPSAADGYGMGMMRRSYEIGGEIQPIWFTAGRAGTLGWVDMSRGLSGIFMVQTEDRFPEYHPKVLDLMYKDKRAEFGAAQGG